LLRGNLAEPGYLFLPICRVAQRRKRKGTQLISSNELRPLFSSSALRPRQGLGTRTLVILLAGQIHAVLAQASPCDSFLFDAIAFGHAIFQGVRAFVALEGTESRK